VQAEDSQDQEVAANRINPFGLRLHFPAAVPFRQSRSTAKFFPSKADVGNEQLPVQIRNDRDTIIHHAIGLDVFREGEHIDWSAGLFRTLQINLDWC